MSNTCENEVVDGLNYTKKLLNGDVESHCKQDESKQSTECNNHSNLQKTKNYHHVSQVKEENVQAVDKNDTLGGYGFPAVSS
jgi:hypothetical protein